MRHTTLFSDALSAIGPRWEDQSPSELAKDWAHFGFDPAEVDRWLAARCFSPMAARDLRCNGLTAERAGQVTAEGGGGPETIGFKVSAAWLLASDISK